jgi:hypothetical protein
MLFAAVTDFGGWGVPLLNSPHALRITNVGQSPVLGLQEKSLRGFLE